jgi:hypothetical protein
MYLAMKYTPILRFFLSGAQFLRMKRWNKDRKYLEIVSCMLFRPTKTNQWINENQDTYCVALESRRVYACCLSSCVTLIKCMHLWWANQNQVLLGSIMRHSLCSWAIFYTSIVFLQYSSYMISCALFSLFVSKSVW